MAPWKRTLYILAFVQFVSAIGMSSIFTFLPLYVDDQNPPIHPLERLFPRLRP